MKKIICFLVLIVSSCIHSYCQDDKGVIHIPIIDASTQGDKTHRSLDSFTPILSYSRKTGEITIVTFDNRYYYVSICNSSEESIVETQVFNCSFTNIYIGAEPGHYSITIRCDSGTTYLGEFMVNCK